MIDTYPEEEKLSNIIREYTGNGGAPFNVLTALYKMKASFPLEGVGVVGDDDNGEEILQQCQNMGINTDQIKILQGEKTSYTDVMTVTSTGKRTFFHSRGANALLNESHFDFTNTDAKILHLGYLLLLDSLDKERSDGLTGAAKVYKKAKEAGLITSADIVSEQSKRFKKIVSSSLQFIDLLFLNEYEATMLTDIEIFNKTFDLSLENAYQAAELILNKGILEWVVIHFPQGVIAMNKKRERIFQRGINLPSDSIKGAVGAGDAFAAGVLFGVHNNWKMEKSLELGVNVAAASLMDVTSTGSIGTSEECMNYGKKFGYKDIYN
ncbi:MAG: carbohydrate kinase family protein [Candidatus Paceibacterota bacterium]